MPLTIVKFDQFNGGLVDAYLSAPNNCGAAYTNLLLDDQGKPYTRPGTICYPTRVPTVVGDTKLSGIYLGSIPYGRPVFFRGSHVYAINETDGFTEIVGPAANAACPNKTQNDFESCIQWRKQLVYGASPSTVLPHRIYCTVQSPTASFTALTLGLPALASAPTVTGSGSGFNYDYAFHYDYTFTDYEGTLFEESGFVTQVGPISNSADPSSANISITGIPVLANSSSTNYDVTSIKIKIFRTINNGTTLYYVGQVTNGTTVFTDSVSDATLQTQVTVYTDGGVLAYNQPPVGSKFITQVNDFFWYATDRVLTHSIQGGPGACPALYQYPIDQKITGLNSTVSFPILFCDRSVYRVDGVFDEFGDGGFDLREISQTAGCVSNRSIVRIPDGLVWAGNGGFYFTDGYQVKKISQGLNTTYQTWKNASIVGRYDSIKNIVFWTVSSSTNSSISQNDTLACLHLNFGIQDYSVFTTLSGQNNIFPTTLGFSESLDVDSRFRSKLLIGDYRGFFLYLDESSYTDPRLNTEIYPSQFSKVAILYNYESAGLKVSDDLTTKYFVELMGSFKTSTDISTQFYSRRDDGGPWATLSEMRQDGAILWETSEYGWDDPNDSILHDWNSIPTVDGMRYFPNQNLRSTTRQVAVRNSLTWLARSDDKGTATTNTLTKTVTLDDNTKFWPGDCEDYYLCFASDNYTTAYQIQTRVSDTQVIVYDPYGTLPAGSTQKWQMKGYRKFERMYLLGFEVHFDNEQTNPMPNRGNSAYINA